MYRDDSETHLEVYQSHNFATDFVRNLRCSTVTSTNVGAC